MSASVMPCTPIGVAADGAHRSFLTGRSLLRRRFRPGRSSSTGAPVAGPFDRQRVRRASSTSTFASSRPSRMPTTTAAQAPVPQASVSPAPRSNTRRRMRVRATTCMKPALTPAREARVALDQRPVASRPARDRRRRRAAPRAGCPSRPPRRSTLRLRRRSSGQSGRPRLGRARREPGACRTARAPARSRARPCRP